MYTALLVYTRMNVVGGESAELRCNTSLTADVMWTYDANNSGIVDYVYWNGHTDVARPRLSVKSIKGGFHSLVIADVQLKDEGLYDCYDDTGSRKVGYQFSTDGI